MISGRPDGSGLGLSITQTILAQHHGLVECESEPGRTAFSFYLPLRQPAVRERLADAATAQPIAEATRG
jgi:two-component system nitrogen regulation sensor histidine kinase GlnL